MVPIVNKQQAAIANTRIAIPPQNYLPESATSLAEPSKPGVKIASAAFFPAGKPL
jgi:hypothetical protein